jgi:hypothetical protein
MRPSGRAAAVDPGAAGANQASCRLTFEARRDTILLEWQGFGHSVVRRQGEGYEQLFELSFAGGGTDLRGRTFDIARMLDDPGHYGMREAHGTGFLDPWLRPAGHVTFGAGNEIVDWYLTSSGGEPYSHQWEHASEAMQVAAPSEGWRSATNLDEFLGLPHYGRQYTEPDSFWFQASPGRWLVETTEPSLLARAPMP